MQPPQRSLSSDRLPCVQSPFKYCCPVAYILIAIQNRNHTTWQTSWVQGHKSSTQLSRDSMSFWLLWIGKKIHEYTIVLANGDHFKGHTHCCLGMVPTALCKQEPGSAYYRCCWNVGIEPIRLQRRWVHKCLHARQIICKQIAFLQLIHTKCWAVVSVEGWVGYY